MIKNTLPAIAFFAIIIGVSLSSSAMALGIALPGEPSPVDTEVSTGPDAPIDGAVVTAPDGVNDSSFSDRQDGCGADIARYAYIRVNAEYLSSIDGSEPIRLVDVCSATSLIDDAYSYNLAQKGNVVGLHNVIAQNPALTAELAAHRYDAADVIAVVPGNGATYLMVHSN